MINQNHSHLIYAWNQVAPCEEAQKEGLIPKIDQVGRDYQIKNYIYTITCHTQVTKSGTRTVETQMPA